MTGRTTADSYSPSGDRPLPPPRILLLLPHSRRRKTTMNPSSHLIQSLSIPSHSTRSSPSPEHTVYNILITTPTHSYTIPHRYSSFASLHTSLSSLSPPPLPPKRSLFSLGAPSESTLVARRAALEIYLRSLLSRAPLASHPAFTTFLAAPPSAAPPPTTSTTWLLSHSSLSSLARSLRGQFAQRDALLLRNDAGAHAVGAEAKKGLVKLVSGVEGLGKGLKELAEAGMVEGELRRRGEMLGSLGDEVEDLGKVVRGGPRPGSGKREVGAGKERESLLKGKGTARVLGAVETAETRPLDNAGLMQLQQTYVGEQDAKLESLTAVLRRQKALGLMIGDELAVQSEVLDGIEEDVRRVGVKMGEAGKVMRKLGT